MDELSAASRPNVVYTYVYSGIKCGPHAGKLSALVVTSSGDVYGAGANTLVRSYMYYGEYPMMAGGEPVLESWVKIDHLCRKGILKIIVGEGFGAALTDDQLLLTWGHGMRTFLGKQAVVMFREYQEDIGCEICSIPTHDYIPSPEVDSVSLSYCGITNMHPIYTPERLPPGDLRLKKFLRYNSGVLVKCMQCMRNMSSKLVNSVALFHCPSCNILWEADEHAGVLGRSEGVFSTNTHNAAYKDIAPHSSGIWILMEGNQLLWWSFEQRPTWTKIPTKNPQNLPLDAVYNVAYTFVLSTGDLYRLNPRNYKLEAISLPSSVVKVRCGFSSVACLLADRSIWFILSDDSPQKLESAIGENCYEDIASAQWSDTYYISSTAALPWIPHPLQVREPGTNRTISFNFTSTNPNTTLISTVCEQRLPISSSAISNPSSSFQHTVTLPPFQVGLYGRQYLSDMTLKLSNEEFPAHRCVLLSTSMYFSKTLFSQQEPHVTLDMSSYNAKAYKALLKYFYQLEPDPLDVDSLLDLYVLADSYEEVGIASDVEGRIKDRINYDNVLRVFGLSTLLNIDTIKDYSEKLMRSQAFKDQLLEKAIENPMMFLLLLDG